MIDVPEVVRNKASAAGATTWLRDLPDLLVTLEQNWSITVGEPYKGGTEAYVARATLDDGTPAVLKLLVPREGDAARREIDVLRLTDGAGCARLLSADVERSALLLERLGPSVHDLGLPLRERHDILCVSAAKVWRPVTGVDLPTGAAKGRWLADYISTMWDELDRPCGEHAVGYALACADRRIAAHDDERAVLVHGDLNDWNALAAHDGGFKLVDPDGLLAEAEYDLGILMREDPVDLLVGDPFDRAAALAARTGLDATAIWEWGVVERVSTGLLATRIGLQPVGAQMLHAADVVAGAG